jgi:hypothetical protein
LRRRRHLARAGFPTLATGSVHPTAPGPAGVTSTPSPAHGPEAIETCPVAHGGLPGTPSGCQIMNTTTDPGVAAWTWSPNTPVTLAGAPVVRATMRL